MRFFQGMTLFCAAMTLSVMPASLGAAVVTETYSGAFPGTVSGVLPNQGTALELSITLPSSGDFEAFTTSYAGGGFQPNLTLFDASGNFVDASSATLPTGAIADPKTGSTLDVDLSAMGLQAGTYTLALTDWQLSQSITATNLSDGFTSNTGNGVNFTDVNGAARNGNYSLTLDFNAASSAVPEPGTWLLTAPLAGGLFLLRRKLAATK